MIFLINLEDRPRSFIEMLYINSVKNIKNTKNRISGNIGLYTRYSSIAPDYL